MGSAPIGRVVARLSFINSLLGKMRPTHWGTTRKVLYSALLNHRSKTMRYSSQVNRISNLRANSAEVLAYLAEQRELLVIMQNGEAKTVLHEVASHPCVGPLQASLTVWA